MRASTEVLAQQRYNLARTIQGVADLSAVTYRIVRDNHAVMGRDLAQALAVARIVHRRQASLAEAFNTMPALAQNMTWSYNWRHGRLRVQFNTNSGPLSPVFREQMCRALGLPLCGQLFRPDGTGALDPFVNSIASAATGGAGSLP